jgi:hypothetical protein
MMAFFPLFFLISGAEKGSADAAMKQKCIKIFVFPVKRYMFFVWRRAGPLGIGVVTF